MISTLISTALALVISTYPSVESSIVMPPQQSKQVAYMDKKDSVKDKAQEPLRDKFLDDESKVKSYEEKIIEDKAQVHKDKEQVTASEAKISEDKKQEKMDKHQEKKDKKKMKKEEKEMKKTHKAGCKRCGGGKTTAVI